MPVEVIMPKVDMDMASGTITTWHAAEGEKVEKGAPLFDIETDKAAMEVESPGSGILRSPAAEGSAVPIGRTVAWLCAEGEEAGPPPENTGGASIAAGAPEPEEPNAPEPAPAHAAPMRAPGPDRPRATPFARSLARAAGLDLADIPGSGPCGRIQRDDVRALLDVPAAAPAGFMSESGPLAVTRSRNGTGAPVVLIHGFAGDAASWAPLEAYLKGRPLIRIDLPCHGRSPKMRIKGFAGLAAEVRRCFDALSLEPAHLVGHSLGGAVSMALADARPRGVASLTLVAPGGLGPEINGEALSGICRAAQAASLGPWLKTLVVDESRITESYVRLAVAGRRDPELRAAQTAMAAALFPDGVQSFDLRPALGRIEAPTRIFWGKSDAIIPWRHALRAPGRVALHLFDGIGHIPQIEAPDEIGRILAGLRP